MDETDNGVASRRLMRRQAHAALATSRDGHPYVSLVALTFDYDASPLLLLSDLAQHSRNIAADPRVSLLFDGGASQHPRADPLAEPRLTWDAGSAHLTVELPVAPAARLLQLTPVDQTST